MLIAAVTTAFTPWLIPAATPLAMFAPIGPNQLDAVAALRFAAASVDITAAVIDVLPRTPAVIAEAMVEPIVPDALACATPRLLTPLIKSLSEA